MNDLDEGYSAYPDPNSHHQHHHHHHHHHHHQHHHKTAHQVLDKITSKISSITDDIKEAVKERSHSTTSSSSDRRSSISSDGTSSNIVGISYRLHDDTPSATIETKYPINGFTGETTTLPSVPSVSSLGSSASQTSMVGPPRHTIDQLALNMGFGGFKPSVVNGSTSSINSAASSAPVSVPVPVPIGATVPAQSVTSASTSSGGNSPPRFDLNDSSSLNQDFNNDSDGGLQERIITKVDPVELIAKPTVVTVPKDSVRRTAMLLSGPKFQLNSHIIPKEEEFNKLDTNTIYRVAIIVGLISLIFAVWKPISSYFSGFFVGILFSGALIYIWIRNYINYKAEETTIEEWIEFPALESMLTKVDKEDKDTNIQVTGASIAFQRYEADRDDDFARYPCDIRLDGYRLIVQLASKPWSDEKKPEKEMKFIGFREYLIKEARMILVPEATLTRAKYWMNDYPIVIQDLQILDKQIHNRQQMEKSKLDTNDFFTNNATILSIWFETSVQKEEWFHKLSLVLRKGKEDIERTNSLMSLQNDSLHSSTSTSSLYRRLAQTENDTELVPIVPSEHEIQAAINETKVNAEELQERAKIKEPATDEIDASGTHRTIARKSKVLTPNEVSLQKILQSPECLDEAAITINFMARRLLCDMFDVPVFKDLLKAKVEMKMKEIAVSILEDLRVVSIDLGNTFPVILKIESMQWNTQGLWFNLFLYYRGSFKLSVKTRVVLQKLINYDPKKDKPIFAQHHSAQIVHKDEERIDEDDLEQRQKLLAKEPEVPEMAVTRKLGTALTNLALNKYFQMFANIPFIKGLFEKFSEEEVGADVEITSFSGLLTLNIPPPPSDRIWVGFPEMPDMNIKVVPTYGDRQYKYTLLQDFLSARIRNELKRLIVLPAMDDQLLPFFRDWVIDIIGEIVSKPINPMTDNYKAKLNTLTAMRENLLAQNTAQDVKKGPSVISTLPTSTESTQL